MRYITLLLALVLLLTACATGETDATDPSTEAPTTESTAAPTEPTMEPTSPTQEPTEPPTTPPTLSPEEYAEQIAMEYLQSRLDYLTGSSDAQVLHAGEALMEEIRTLRQTLADDGITLKDGSFYFSGIEYEDSLTVLYMGKHISYSTDEGGFEDDHIYRLDMETGADGTLVVVGDAVTRPYYTQEEGEAYARQIVMEYLQSRFDYLSGDGQTEVANVSEAMMSSIEAERQTLADEGVTLIDAQYTIGDVYYEGTYSYVMVLRTVTYTVGAQETTDEIQYKLFVCDGMDGQYVVASDNPVSEEELP